MVILSLIQEIEDEKLPKLLKPIRSHLDDILAPFRQVESIHTDLLEFIPQPMLDALVLAGHHDHLSYPSHGKNKHYHRRESWYASTSSFWSFSDPFGSPRWPATWRNPRKRARWKKAPFIIFGTISGP
jgi:hypothetical protein